MEGPLKSKCHIVPIKNRLWRPCLQMNRDDMSTCFFRGPSIDASYQVSIHLAKRQTWPPQAILISDCSIKKKFSSETALPNELKLRRKHLWKVLYKDCTFRHISLTAAMFANESGRYEHLFF
jgi:hypothetical protein